MRKAFIGFSSPIAYSYKFENEKGHPNPILDSPIGLFLFYDEIWFLDKKLCPYNMQSLPYVHFLSEEYDLSKLDLRQLHLSLDEISKIIPAEKREEARSAYDRARHLNIQDGWLADNHGRGISVGNDGAMPNPTENNLIIDDYIARQFGLELITNSYTYYASTTFVSHEVSRQLAHAVLAKNIPNFQMIDGPYHPLIDDLRSDSFLKDFRGKVKDLANTSDISVITNLSEQMEHQFDLYTTALVLKHFDKKRIFKGIADAVVGQVPILSNVYSAVDGGKTVFDAINARKNYGWVGFLANAKLIRETRS